MKRKLAEHTGVRLALLVLALAVAASGCGRIQALLETSAVPEPVLPTQRGDLPQAYARSQINDPKLEQFAREFKAWALEQTAEAANPGAVFSRVEVLPPTRTVLPYGVGAYEQELRLPTILTVGPAWTSQAPEAREAVAALAFRTLSEGIDALKLDRSLRPTLTIQTPSGLELAWMNDLAAGRRNIHGDDMQPRGDVEPPLPPRPTPIERGGNVDGDQP